METESFFKRQNIKKWIVRAVIVFLAWIVIREIIGLFIFHNVFNQVSNHIDDQKRAVQELHQKTNAEMKKIEDKMSDQQLGMSEAVSKMQTDMNNFHKEFSEGVTKFNKEWEEDAKRREDFHKMADELMVEHSRKIDADMKKVEAEFWADSKKEQQKKLALEKAGKTQKNLKFETMKKSIVEGYRY